MGRNSNPLLKRNGVYYARWYQHPEEGVRPKAVVLSLGTGDLAEAMKRYPAVKASGKSWAEYQNSIEGFAERPTATVHSIGDLQPGRSGTRFDPPIQFETSREGIKAALENALKKGWAKLNPTTGEWIIEIPDTTENTNMDSIEGLTKLRQSLNLADDSSTITKFYRETVTGLYLDKPAALRNAEIWLHFLEENGVKSWSAISESLVTKFREFRATTKIRRNNREGTLPSGLVIRRHLQYLSKSFDLAQERDFLKYNPIKYWKPEPHTPPLQEGLTPDELVKVLSDEKWKQNFMMSGSEKHEMPFRLLDFILILFTACKRRKEIINLKIEDLNFVEHFASYEEHKNSSRGTSYQIRKAFWLTPVMEKLFKRIIGGRTEGLVFMAPQALRTARIKEVGLLNGDYISELFRATCTKYAPAKEVSLHNLRHTATDILERAGLSAIEIDNALGHYNVETALKHYQDRSAEAVARRLSGMTKKGVEILSKTVEKFYQVEVEDVGVPVS